MKMVRHSRGRQRLAQRKRQVFQAVSSGVREGHEQMIRDCPVDKGDLLSTTTREDDGEGHVTLGTGGQSGRSDMWVSHHVYIEFGTKKMGAQPYFRGGVDTAKQAARRRLKAIK